MLFDKVSCLNNSFYERSKSSTRLDQIVLVHIEHYSDISVFNGCLFLWGCIIDLCQQCSTQWIEMWIVRKDQVNVAESIRIERLREQEHRKGNASALDTKIVEVSEISYFKPIWI